MNPYKINLDKIRFTQSKITTESEDIIQEFHDLGYSMFGDYNFSIPTNSEHHLIIKSSKMLQDKKVKEILMEYLI